MQQEEGYIKETLTFYRPALSGRQYLNNQDFDFIGSPDGKFYIVEKKDKKEQILDDVEKDK